jgi:hypothetical protein
MTLRVRIYALLAMAGGCLAASAATANNDDSCDIGVAFPQRYNTNFPRTCYRGTTVIGPLP